MASLVWNQSSTNRRATRAADGLFSPPRSYDGREEIAAFQDVVFRQSWMVTVATVVNVSPSPLVTVRNVPKSQVPVYVHVR